MPFSPPPQSRVPAVIGGIPTTKIDTPISSVFLFIFICFAAINMTIYLRNGKRSHKFLPSAVLFGFSMARINTFALRISWAEYPRNQDLALAAQIFVNAGVLVLYIVNLLFAQRVLRGKIPVLGWHPVLRFVYKALWVGTGGALAMLITAVILMSKTKNQHIKTQCRDIQLAALTWLFMFSVLPLVHLLAVLAMPSRDENEVDFGHGSMRTKIQVLAASTCFCVVVSGFKLGTAWSTPRMASNPAWYHSRAAFYGFGFVPELLALSLLTFTRVDKRFHVPDGSSKVGGYGDGQMKGPYGMELASQTTAEASDAAFGSASRL